MEKKYYRFVAIVDVIFDINKFGRSQKLSNIFLNLKRHKYLNFMNIQLFSIQI
jgi:hypothetical protein